MDIKDFLIDYDKKKQKKKFFIKGKITTEVKKNISFLIGYKILKNKQKFGEYLDIKFKNRIIKINNDDFGTYPVYIFKSLNRILISSCLSWLINKTNKEININIKQLYTYFGWGYIPASNCTLYDNIKTLGPKETLILGKKLSIKKYKTELFKKKNIKLNINIFFNLLQNKILNIFNVIDYKKSYMGLTSGYDSLLGTQLINKNNFRLIVN